MRHPNGTQVTFNHGGSREARQIRKKVGEIYNYEAKQSYAVVAKVVDGSGASDSIHMTLKVCRLTGNRYQGEK